MEDKEIKGCGRIITGHYDCGNHSKNGIFLCDKCLNDAHENRFG